MKFDMRIFFENLLRKFKFHQNRPRKTGTLHEDQCIFFITSRSFLLIVRNVSDKSCRDIKTHILCSVTVFRKSCRLCDNVEKYCTASRPQTTMWRMRIACWVHKATYTFRLCNTYCFSSEKKVFARTRLNFTLYVH